MLGYSQLTMLWQFQVNSKGTQPYIFLDPFFPKLPSHPGCHVTISRVYLDILYFLYLPYCTGYNKMLTSKDETKHLCLVLDLRRTALGLSLLIMTLVAGFSQMPFIRLRKFYFEFKIFKNQTWMLDFIKRVFCIFYNVMWLFKSLLM